jgi:hypothetical protein
MALSRIQAAVFGRAGIRPGDYSAYAAQVESLFTNPVAATLDEYGIPLELAEKLRRVIGTTTDLDLALANIKKCKVGLLVPELHPFERELVKDTQAYL